MIQKLKTLIVIAFTSFAFLTPALAVPALGGVASADIKGSLCTGVDAAAGTSNCNQATGDSNNGLRDIAAQITTWFSIIVGAISVIMIIYGGFRYITSGGDSGKVGNAKNTLIYAIVGLIIVALAQLIVRFVITEAGEATTGL